jgi:hypothetical protein
MTVITEIATSANLTNVPVLGSLGSDVGFVLSEAAGNDNGQSDQLLRIAHRVLTNGETITPLSPCGSNCSYSHFWVPRINASRSTCQVLRSQISPMGLIHMTLPWLLQFNITLWTRVAILSLNKDYGLLLP